MKRFLSLALLLTAASIAGSYTYVWSPTAKWGAGAIPGPSGNVTWLMNSAGTPDYAGGPPTNDGEVLLIVADLLDWENSTAGNLDLEYGGSTSADATYGDGLNVIFWNESWTTPAGVAGLGGSVVDGSNTIIEGNVELNGTMTWTASLIEGINLHELGHALGLGHSAVSGAVMAPSFTGTLDPQPDDIAGMSSLYGTGPGGDGVPVGAPPPPPPPPSGGGGGSSSSSSDDDDDDHKKRCGLTGLEFPLLLGLWALGRRASRTIRS